ncbi:hypothetical protein HOLleu_02025 [Holothuria leucospilota]|uniref:Uncharacterized protein n=1 Tax=Holothuria leucospilota TaxID=206669 RepID=A0A9Q1CR71_HOLLE|nr:hypothetical protein HOLleu_02025 [Holothuria leucospilota]
MEKNENVTSYIIRAEKIIGPLERAKEVPSEKLLISILLKGLPPTYRQFSIHVPQSSEDISLSKFTVALKGFEETECFESHVSPKQQDGTRTSKLETERAVMVADPPSIRLKIVNKPTRCVSTIKEPNTLKKTATDTK